MITRGHSLYAVDDVPAAFLLYGALPAWRDFAPGMTDGDDVRQLERNLRALGYDPGDVDGDWDAETTDAVERFQRDRGLDGDGRLAAASSSSARADAGRRGEGVGWGPRRRPAARWRALLDRPPGDRRPRRAASSSPARATVTVDLPSGRSVHGRVAEVGNVATSAARTRRSP